LSRDDDGQQKIDAKERLRARQEKEAKADAQAQV
jgi:hypothetical protein